MINLHLWKRLAQILFGFAEIFYWSAFVSISTEMISIDHFYYSLHKSSFQVDHFDMHRFFGSNFVKINLKIFKNKYRI